MTDNGADVIPIRPGIDGTDDDRPLMTKRPPLSPYCRHIKFTLDTEKRRVYCRSCGREVDAFEALLVLASTPERWMHHRQEAERRARVAQANLDALLRDERNAKARKRRRDA